MDWDREQLAAWALETADMDGSIDPDLLALELGLEVRDGGPGCQGLLVGDLILVDEGLRRERRGYAICHEIGHWLQLREGMQQPGERTRRAEQGANYLASALLLPRLHFEAQLRRFGWDLLRLKSEHTYASWEALARRIVALRDARAFVFDRPRGRRERWYSVPYGLRPCPQEQEAAEVARATGAPCEPVAGLWGWPVLQEDWSRVIVVRSV